MGGSGVLSGLHLCPVPYTKILFYQLFVFILTPAMSNRACNALALFQCIASHPKTRNELVECRIPVFLYPFLRANTSETTSTREICNEIPQLKLDFFFLYTSFYTSFFNNRVSAAKLPLLSSLLTSYDSRVWA